MLGKVTAIARSGSAGLIRRASGAPRVRASGPRAISCSARKAPPSISFFLDQALVSSWSADEEGQRVLQPLESVSVKGAMAEESDTRARKRAKTNPNVNEKRRLVLKEGRGNDGPVIYWMSRDQRMQDNWALLWACEQASNRGQAVAVAFTLVEEYMLYGARQFGFMLRGLRELPEKLKERGIEFFLLHGAPEEEVPKLCSKAGASLLVMDFLPLRQSRLWREAVAEKVDCGVDLVDAHNIVPVWQASDKQEYAARTIRGKIHRKLPEFLTEFPEVPSMAAKWPAEVQPAEVDWDKVLQQAISRDTSVPEVSWLTPGEDAARAALADFVSTRRLKMYSDKRNDPNHPQALSNLSPFLHFGQLSAQRAAIEAAQHRKNHKEAVESFLEELVVRRELSDNFCHYQEQYDSLGCAAGWAKETLDTHRGDEREHLYTRDQLEQAKTHDELWNAAQKEMVHMGKMHGFMRMYWAKKILEWTESPDQALAIAIYLNDKYELDGCDPNGYVGVAWSICGIHDQGWKERAVFGKIRYMNFAGCKRKFDVQGYISRVNRQVKAGGGKATPWTK